ncbi:MAG: 3'-5' exonuclease, partial [Myxococcota bacterium]
QAIYGFRNADIARYHAACDEVRAAGAKTVVLDRCYRSTEPLIAAYNRILDGFFSGSNRYPHPVRCGDPARRFFSTMEETAAPVVLYELEKAPVAKQRRVLAQKIAQEIKTLVEGAWHVADAANAPRTLGWSDIFVLTRTTEESRQVATALSERDVPFALFKQEGLFQTREAQDIDALLFGLASPSEPSRQTLAFLTPFFGIEAEQIAELRAKQGLDRYIEVLRDYQRLAFAGDYARLFHRALMESGLSSRLLFSHQDRRSLANYEQLFELLLEETGRLRLLPMELAKRFRAFQQGRAAPKSESANVQRVEGDSAAVQILTIHKSKGLEAHIVFLFGGFARGRTSRDEPKIFHEQGVRCGHLGTPNAEIEAQVRLELQEEDERLLYVAMTRAKSRLYLPVLPGRLGGSYRVLNDRLQSLLLEIESRSPQALDGGDAQELFALRSISSAPEQEEFDSGSTPSADIAALPIVESAHPGLRAALESWRFPRVAQPPAIDGFLRAAASRFGTRVTSYTQMKQSGYQASEPESNWLKEPAFETEEEAVAAESNGIAAEFVCLDSPERSSDLESDLDQDMLPGGAAIGVFLHEAIEHLDFEVVQTVSYEDFLSDREIERIFGRAAANSGVSRDHLRAAKHLVWRALRSPIVCGPIRLGDGLCSVTSSVAEMSFLYPLPELTHPSLHDGSRYSLQSPRGDASMEDETPFHVDRGFVRGVIDLVFEYEGRVYLLDWKSDRLENYRSLSLHVEKHYRLQVKLYTLGVVRLLRLSTAEDFEARFGGILYCFLRNMPEATIFYRPDFEDVCRWEQSLSLD